MKIPWFAVQVKKPGYDFTLCRVRLEVVHRRDSIVRVIFGVNFSQPDDAAVVLHDLLDGPRFVVGRNLFAPRHEVEAVDYVVVLANVVIALRGACMVVEGYAGTDDIQQGGALVLDGCLDQRDELRLVAGEAPCDEARTELQREANEVQGGVGIHYAALRLGSGVRGGGELALGQSVHAVVLHHVKHVYTTAQGVRELAEADGGGVTVAGNAEIQQVAVGEIGAGQHRRHAAVHAVQPVGASEEVGGRLR